MTTMLDRLPTGTTWPEALGLDGIEDRANDLLANDLVNESYAITLDPIRFEDLLTV
jgi:hypothetical protein